MHSISHCASSQVSFKEKWFLHTRVSQRVVLSGVQMT